MQGQGEFVDTFLAPDCQQDRRTRKPGQEPLSGLTVLSTCSMQRLTSIGKSWDLIPMLSSCQNPGGRAVTKFESTTSHGQEFGEELPRPDSSRCIELIEQMFRAQLSHHGAVVVFLHKHRPDNNCNTRPLIMLGGAHLLSWSTAAFHEGSNVFISPC